MMNKEELLKNALEYIEASQKVKAAKDVLERLRDKIKPAFRKLVRANGKGSRTITFDSSKIMLIPQHKANESAVKKALGGMASNFTDRSFVVDLSLIEARLGQGIAAKVEKDLKQAVSNVLKDNTVNIIMARMATKVVEELNTKAAVASLGKEARRKVMDRTGDILRPYPEGDGYEDKLIAASEWLNK
jgi:hypothetical protein